MADVFGVTEILVAHAMRVQGEHLALIAYYGSYAKGQASPTSDLDMFYIPDEGWAESLNMDSSTLPHSSRMEGDG